MLSKKVDDSKFILITKPDKENSMEASKYRPISLLNIGGKVLEKLLIHRLNHHIYKNELLMDSQYGFTQQKNYNRRSYEGKKFIDPELEKKVGCYNDKPRRERSFRRSVVAKRPKGSERFRMS
jgi:hypothetical protein